MKICHILILALGLVFCSTVTNAQIKKENTTNKEKEKDNEEETDLSKMKFKDRLRFGGQFGASFGNPTFVNVSPFVGYQVSKKFITGVGLTYIYFSQTDVFGNKYQSSTYGARSMSQYTLISNIKGFGNIAAQAEIEALNFEYYDFSESDYARTWLVNPLVGLSIVQPIGGRSSFYASILYNLTFYSTPIEKNPYSSPWVIRVGFSL